MGRENEKSNWSSSNNRYGRANNYNDAKTPDQTWNEAGFKKEWITKSIDASFPEFAEQIGKFMADNNLTNSKIRSVYGEMKRIQMGDFDKEKASFYLLRPKVAYALGRDKDNRGLQMFKKMFDECALNVTDKKSFLNFCNVFEAVLAYHKAYGGKD